jgi:glutamate synthase domain-containing protein 1
VGRRSSPAKEDSTICGIVAYIGRKPAKPILLEGLKRLEYRGYDSAGLAVMNHGIHVAKTVGRVAVLEEKLQDLAGFEGSLGIAHTRWATHGEPADRNAHPHTDNAANGHGIALIHNGIIENYAALKTYLEEKGHTFTSETDTEVLTHLIGELYDGDLERGAEMKVEGDQRLAARGRVLLDVAREHLERLDAGLFEVGAAAEPTELQQGRRRHAVARGGRAVLAVLLADDEGLVIFGRVEESPAVGQASRLSG